LSEILKREFIETVLEDNQSTCVTRTKKVDFQGKQDTYARKRQKDKKRDKRENFKSQSSIELRFQKTTSFSIMT